MQLPPTILSINGKKEKKSDLKFKPATSKKSPSAKATAAATPTASAEAESDADSSEDTESEDLEAAVTAVSKLSLENKPRVAKLVPPRTLETTLFDRLEGMYGAGIKRMLEVQYR
jgi:DNA polymerase alpha-associated DNA helicase A